MKRGYDSESQRLRSAASPWRTKPMAQSTNARKVRSKLDGEPRPRPDLDRREP